jgi:hypothetical protein
MYLEGQFLEPLLLAPSFIYADQFRTLYLCPNRAVQSHHILRN